MRPSMTFNIVAFKCHRGGRGPLLKSTSSAVAEMGDHNGHGPKIASMLHLGRGVGPAPNFRPMFVVAKQLDGLRCHLVWRWASAQVTFC